MAVVLPFAAFRYDEKKIGSLSKVVTEPFDKITPAMQQEYFRRSPYNYARLIKGETRPTDTASDNVYTRAAEWLREWREQQILVRSGAPAFYAYCQKFTAPDSPGGPAFIRSGFVGLGQIERYENGIIFPHERTHSAAKADRLELLRATRAHLESIFLLYSDPERRIEAVLDQQTQGPPKMAVKDDYGVEHILWDVADPKAVQALQQGMADKKLIIADGHHRYQTAMNFRQECEARHPGKKLDCAFAMMTFVNMEGDGILILPTHRLLSNITGWNAQEFLQKAGRYFSIQEFLFSGGGPGGRAGEGPMREALAKMQAAMSNSSGTSFGALFESNSQNGNAFYCLTQRQEPESARLLADLTPAERSLDVTVLDRIVLGQCLGVDQEAIQKERHLAYVRHFDEGIQGVMKGGAQACFFLNPVKIEQVREIAFSGRVLPQKSTDFYPKLLSGLLLYTLEH